MRQTERERMCLIVRSSSFERLQLSYLWSACSPRCPEECNP
jgi:hypothetical protein